MASQGQIDVWKKQIREKTLDELYDLLDTKGRIMDWKRPFVEREITRRTQHGYSDGNATVFPLPPDHDEQLEKEARNKAQSEEDVRRSRELREREVEASERQADATERQVDISERGVDAGERQADAGERQADAAWWNLGCALPTALVAVLTFAYLFLSEQGHRWFEAGVKSFFEWIGFILQLFTG